MDKEPKALATDVVSVSCIICHEKIPFNLDTLYLGDRRTGFKVVVSPHICGMEARE